MLKELHPRPAHRDVKVVLHLQLLQALQRLQAADVLQMVVTQVQVAKSRKVQVPGQLLQLVPGQIPALQRPQARQQEDGKVLQRQLQPRKTEQQQELVRFPTTAAKISGKCMQTIIMLTLES